jgi:hypothetical protein
MSLSAIKSITEAEEAVKNAKLDAQVKMKRDAEQAEQEGRDSIANSLTQADGEIRHLKREAELKAEDYAKNLASSVANKRAALAAHADAMLGTAADLIVERIVSG